MTYFNEFDPYASQWIRNLYPSATVDSRTILDVQPADVAGFLRCHFFAGIGGWEYALDLAGWPDAWPMWTGSAPCQPYSAAGKGKGDADERNLWPEFFRLIRECRPPIVLGEQVASKAALGWYDGVAVDLRSIRYHAIVADVPAGGVGAPHIRQRLFWAAVNEDVYRLQDRAALGGIHEKFQRLLLETMQDLHRFDAEGEVRPGEGSRLDEEESRSGFGERCEKPGEAEGNGVQHHGGRREPSPEGGSLPGHWDQVQPRRRQDVGQPIAGPHRLHEGLHQGELPDRALLRERDGERLGREHDFADRQGNCGDSADGERELSRAADGGLEAEYLDGLFTRICVDMERAQDAGWESGSGSASDGPEGTSGVAIASGAEFGRRTESAGEHGGAFHAANGGGTGGLAVANVPEFCRLPPAGQQPLDEQDHGVGCGLPDAGGTGRERRAEHDGRMGGSNEPANYGATDRLGHAEHSQRRPFHVTGQDGCDRQDSRRAEAHGEPGTCGQVCSADAWHDSILIPCRDGKLRRISSQSGDEPLAYGIPRSMGRGQPELGKVVRSARSNRTGRLRGYGNAIVPQVAAVFIRSVMEALRRDSLKD